MKIIFLILIIVASVFAQNAERQYQIADANKIKVQVWNYGSLSKPGNRVTNFVWNGLGYGYEFSWFIGAEVAVPEGSHPDVKFIDNEWRAHIISDGNVSDPEVATNGSGLLWGFQPIKTGYTGIPYQDDNAYLPYSRDIDRNNDGMIDGWPDAWQNIWPAKWLPGISLGDNEIIYGIDDRDNREFKYYPFPEDSSLGGLGIDVETRVIQIQDFYEDILFVVYVVKNVSEKDLDRVLSGIWGDPHIGGPNDFSDDLIFHNVEKNLVYAWDNDGISDIPGVAPGYFGITFLQTAGNDEDEIDNDNDGMTDESPYNNIDDDDDWDKTRDDLGADGLPNTGDNGENDGSPTIGEPNFELNDFDETDMIGLTSQTQPEWGSISLRDDEEMWSKYLKPGSFDTINSAGDRILTGGSGYFSLKAGQEARFALAFIFGQDLNELFSNTQLAKEIYKVHLGGFTYNYQFNLSSVDSGMIFINGIPANWESSSIHEDAKLEFALSNDNGKNWLAVERNIQNSGQSTLDVTGFESSAFFKLRSRAISNTEYGQTETKGFFTIDNSGDLNVPPEVLPLFENGIHLSNQSNLKWLSADVDGNDFSTKIILESSLVCDTLHPVSNTFLLNTREYPNDAYILKFIVNDGMDEREVIKNILIRNEYDQLNESYVLHIKGYSESELFTHIVNLNNISGSIYKVFFDDSNPDQKTYTVFDSSQNIMILDDQNIPAHPNMGNEFSGLRMSFTDIPFGINETETGWGTGSSTDLRYNLIERDSAKFYPSDYQITFYNDSVDVAVTGQSVNFEVWNITLDQKNYVAVTEPASNRNGKWDVGDDIFILENVVNPGVLDAKKTSWQIKLEPESEQTEWIDPKEGDVFYLKTYKPLTSNDVYIIDSSPLSISKDETKFPFKFQIFQNFPNPFNNSTKIKFTMVKSGTVEFEIYNILGQNVLTQKLGLRKAGINYITWNGKNNENNLLASGLYFYRIKSAENSSLLKKMILLK